MNLNKEATKFYSLSVLTKKVEDHFGLVIYHDQEKLIDAQQRINKEVGGPSASRYMPESFFKDLKKSVK